MSFMDDVRKMNADELLRELVTCAADWSAEYDSDFRAREVIEAKIEALGIAHMHHAPDCRAAESANGMDCGSAECRWELGRRTP